MNAIASPVARIAGVAIVLILAAALGLIAGSALNARVDVGAGAGAATPHMSGFDGARYDSQQSDAASVGTPSYADPYRLHINGGAPDAAAIGPQTWGNLEAAPSDDVAVGPETWGNIEERQDVRSSESLTAPTPR